MARLLLALLILSGTAALVPPFPRTSPRSVSSRQRADASEPSPPPAMDDAAPADRRSFVVSLTGAAVATASLLAPPAALAGDGSAFVGTYSDPNHPGGTRTVRLLDPKVGDYQLAEVTGGGGRGEPKSFVLPAVVVGDRAIIIDFSPKGGPRDFTGVLDGEGIKFLRDGNRWPKI